MTAMTVPPATPPIEPRRPGFCSLMDGPTRRCLEPAHLYPGGWRCEKHRPRQSGEQAHADENP